MIKMRDLLTENAELVRDAKRLGFQKGKKIKWIDSGRIDIIEFLKYNNGDNTLTCHFKLTNKNQSEGGTFVTLWKNGKWVYEDRIKLI